MRARNLKPSFFVNSKLAECSPLARILFQGLWCMADRRGRLEDDPKKIKACILPYDETEISTMLEQLQHHAFILRYQAKGNSYIQIINFEKHQYPHIKESESTIPAPGKHHTSPVQNRLNPESPFLNPESPLPHTANPDKPGLAGVFESLWGQYPKRLGKKEALRHFMASVKTEVDVKKIRSALANYQKQVEGKDRQYIQNGSTWFNNWQDWIDFTTAEIPKVTSLPPPPVFEEIPESERMTAEEMQAIKDKALGGGKCLMQK